MSELKTKLIGELRKTMRPEFLNRIDEIVMFQPLLQSDLRKIVDLQLENLVKMVQKEGMEIMITGDAREWLAKTGYDAVYGARPLKRVIQKQIVDPLAMKFLGGEFVPGDGITVDHNERGQYTFTKK
jgi:ATP-dependent Clp protease ATP-binding subunit ClpB